MKTKTLLFLCLFLGLGLTQLSAQNKAVQYKVMDAEYHTAAFCGGVQVAFLQGTARLHIVYHEDFKSGWFEIDQYKGEAVSVGFTDENGNFVPGTGEDFEVKEIDHFSFPNYPYVMWHYELKGNKGTHYIGFLYFDWDAWVLTPGKVECN